MKTYRVFVRVEVEAYYDIAAATVEEAEDEVAGTGLTPMTLEDETGVKIVDTLGAIPLEAIESGVSYQDCLSEIAQRREAAALDSEEQAEALRAEAEGTD